jgi:hypothetical protein
LPSCGVPLTVGGSVLTGAAFDPEMAATASEAAASACD